MFEYIKETERYYHILNETDANGLTNIVKKWNKSFNIGEIIPYKPILYDNHIVIEEKKISRIGIKIDKNCPKIPKEINEFRNLKHLYIYLNDLDLNFEAPQTISPNIETLYVFIHGNKEKYYINHLNCLPNLILLFIYSEGKRWLSDPKTFTPYTKPLIVLPENICTLRKLEYLKIGFCNIKHLPESLNNLAHLKRLIINGSNLKRLPEQILNLKSIETLNLENTYLEVLPKSLLSNKSIRSFTCEPYLITEEIKKWIEARELIPFGEKGYKEILFFD